MKKRTFHQNLYESEMCILDTIEKKEILQSIPFPRKVHLNHSKKIKAADCVALRLKYLHIFNIQFNEVNESKNDML